MRKESKQRKYKNLKFLVHTNMYEYVSYLVKLNILFTFALGDTVEMNRGERQKEETEGETGWRDREEKQTGETEG